MSGDDTVTTYSASWSVVVVNWHQNCSQFLIHFDLYLKESQRAHNYTWAWWSNAWAVIESEYTIINNNTQIEYMVYKYMCVSRYQEWTRWAQYVLEAEAHVFAGISIAARAVAAASTHTLFMMFTPITNMQRTPTERRATNFFVFYNCRLFVLFDLFAIVHTFVKMKRTNERTTTTEIQRRTKPNECVTVYCCRRLLYVVVDVVYRIDCLYTNYVNV